jgi:type II secretory pathway component PulJ
MKVPPKMTASQDVAAIQEMACLSASLEHPNNAEKRARRGTPPPSRAGLVCPSQFHTRVSGFTLLEIILSVGLIVMLSAGVYGFYEEVLQTREQIHRKADEAFAQRRVMDIIGQEMSDSLVYPLFQTGMSGANQQVTFLRTDMPPRSLFAAGSSATDRPSITSRPAVAPQQDVVLVGYRLNRYLDEDGNPQIGGLERTCQRTLAAAVVEEGVNVEVTLLTDQVKFIRLQYFDGSEWLDSWGNKVLPVAVKVTLGTEPLPEAAEGRPEEYPYPTVSRTIDLPVGSTGSTAFRAGATGLTGDAAKDAKFGGAEKFGAGSGDGP